MSIANNEYNDVIQDPLLCQNLDYEHTARSCYYGNKLIDVCLLIDITDLHQSCAQCLPQSIKAMFRDNLNEVASIAQTVFID